MYKFKRVIPSRMQIANQKITELLKIIDRTNINQNAFYDIKLILNELVVNGIKHGNEHDSNKNVHFEVNITEDKITITISNTIEGNTSIEIRDNGIGIASKSTRKRAKYEGTHNGLSLIHKMIDMLNSKNDNKISFTITDLSTISEDEHGTLICYIIPTIYRFD